MYLFLTSFLLSWKSKNKTQRNAEQVLQASYTPWIYYNMWTQNLILLTTSAFPEPTRFYLNETATQSGKLNTSCALEGTT
jgi:hypothetical protein